MNKRSDITSSSIAVLYVRASTNKQKLTLEAQKRAAGEWSAHNVLPVVETIVDANMSTDHSPHSRKAFLECLATIKAVKADFLLVTDRDRVARNKLHMALVEKELAELDPPCRIITTSQDPNTEVTPELDLQNGVTDLMSQYEKAKIKQRTIRTLRESRAQGRLPGPKAWASFTRGQLTIQLVKRLHKSGFSNGAVVRYFEAQGLLSPHRGKFSMAHVRLCLGSDYPDSDIGETIDSLTAAVMTAKYYQPKYAPGDSIDRARLHA